MRKIYGKIRKVGKRERIKKTIHKPNIIIPSLFKVKGVYNFFSIKNGKKTLIDVKENLVMDACINQIAKAFIGYFLTDYYNIQYLAIGDDDTAVTGSDSVLGNEVFRTPFIIRTNPSTGVVVADFYITDSEYSGDIEEIGIFGGYGTSGTKDDGYLLSHVLWSYNKSSSEEILIEYTLTIS